MADIFISYSSTDRGDAEQLMEQLTSAGLSVWLDKHGIDTATNWSREIVQAIDECKVMILLLSARSVGSHNVVKEVSIAAEQRKPIIPIDIEPVALNDDFRYHLAGLQRSPVTDIDAIHRALARLGLGEAPMHTEGKDEGRRMRDEWKREDERKTLMILPFDDLSPSGDNQWFADGIVSEMITALSNVKALRITDVQTTKGFRRYQGTLPDYAREMRIRYFVQGDVRMFGDRIKISSRLLDIENAEYLWQESLNGTMEDIFEIQETVARKVVEGLHVLLTEEEEKEIDRKPTQNTEAYALWLKSNEYFYRQTKTDLERSLILIEEAVQRDPSFTLAYVDLANINQEMFRLYNRNPELLDRATEAAEKVKELEGESAKYFWVMSLITLRRNDAQGAKRFALKAIEADPTYEWGYDTLGIACQLLGEYEETIAAFEECVRLKENDKSAHFNLLISLHELGDTDRLRIAAERALPIFERHIRLNPDDYHSRVRYILTLQDAGRVDDALREADAIFSLDSPDGIALYNLACLYINCNALERGLELLVRSVAKGFTDIETFQRDPDLDPLRGMPEFEVFIKELEAKNTVGNNG